MWKKIRDFNYSINENGEIRNDKTQYIKVATKCKSTGYLMVDLWKDNKSHKIPLHRLVAEAFIPNPYNKPTVDHKDGNRTNNSINNLRWATYSEQNSRFNTIGVRSERIKATHYVEERKKRGGGHVSWIGIDRIEYFNSITDVANKFNCSISNISLMLKKGTIGQRGRTRGYLFEYCKQKQQTN